MFLVELKEKFIASHAVQIPNGKWEQSHQHQWELRVFLTRRKLNKFHMVVDFHVVKKVLRSILDKFEDQNLNNITAIGKSPTTELIARYIFDQLNASLAHHGVKVTSVALREENDCWAWYTPDCHRPVRRIFDLTGRSRCATSGRKRKDWIPACTNGIFDAGMTDGLSSYSCRL